MNIPQVNKLSHASQLSLVAVVILLGAIFFTINNAMQEQNTAGHASGGTNILLNPSFESGKTNWLFISRSPASANFTTTTSTAEDGATAAQVTTSQVSSDSNNNWYVQLYQTNLPIIAEQKYTVSFWAKASGTNRDIEHVIQQTNSPYALYAYKDFYVTTSWQQYTYTFTAPASQSNAFFGFNLADATGTVWLDNLSFSNGIGAVPTATPVPTSIQPTAAPISGSCNLLTDPGFENGSTGWNLWSGTSIVTGNAHTGSYAMVTTGNDTDAGQYVHNIKPGATYTLSAWTKLNQISSGKAVVLLDYYDASGNYISDVGLPQVTSTSYTFGQTTSVAPSNASYVLVQNYNGTGASLYMDDVYFGNSTCTTPAPTLLPTATPYPTATPVPTTIPVATTTATPQPTDIPQPTDTPVPGSTVLSLDVGLHGIGNGGDSASPGSQGNMNPLHPERTVTADIYDTQNQLVVSQQGTITYDSNSGRFSGTVNLGTNFATGLYTVKIKTDQYLRALVPGIQSITSGQTTTLPAVTLVDGDINGDNAINIVDYNILIGCYSDLLPPTDCPSGEDVAADITDDGHVNQFDYNLFLRELTNIGGQ